jgi:hypothetical protein
VIKKQIIINKMKFKNSSLLFSLLILFVWTACSNNTKNYPPESLVPTELLPPNSKAPLPWIRVNQEGALYCMGKKIDLEAINPQLKAAFAKMEVLPSTIPPVYEGEVLMGMRGEIETEIAQALFEAKYTTAVTEVVHGFFKWYFKDNSQFEAANDFIDRDGDFLELNLSKLDNYLMVLKKTGFISDEFIKKEKIGYQKCAKLWKKETEGPYSCLDADRFTCSQDAPDLLIDHYTTLPVQLMYMGDNRVKAQLIEEGWVSDLELIRVDNSWLIAKFECEL